MMFFRGSKPEAEVRRDPVFLNKTPCAAVNIDWNVAGNTKAVNQGFNFKMGTWTLCDLGDLMKHIVVAIRESDDWLRSCVEVE